jgi:hypothetical protein
MYELDNESILNIIKLSNVILTFDNDKNHLSLPFSTFYQNNLNVSFENYKECSLSYFNNVDLLKDDLNKSNNDSMDNNEKVDFSINTESDNNKVIGNILNVYLKKLNQVYMNNEEKSKTNLNKSRYLLNDQTTYLSPKKNNRPKTPTKTNKINKMDFSQSPYTNIKSGNNSFINNNNNNSYISNTNDDKSENNYNNYYNQQKINRANIHNYQVSSDNQFMDGKKKKTNALIKEKEMLKSIIVKKLAHKERVNIRNDFMTEKEKKKNADQLNERDKVNVAKCEGLLEINLTRNFTPDFDKNRKKRKYVKKKKEEVPTVYCKIDFESMKKKNDEIKLKTFLKDNK